MMDDGVGLFTIQEMESTRDWNLFKRPARTVQAHQPAGTWDSSLGRSAHLRNQVIQNDQIIGRGECWGKETVSESGEVEEIQQYIQFVLGDAHYCKYWISLDRLRGLCGEDKRLWRLG